MGVGKKVGSSPEYFPLAFPSLIFPMFCLVPESVGLDNPWDFPTLLNPLPSSKESAKRPHSTAMRNPTEISAKTKKGDMQAWLFVLLPWINYFARAKARESWRMA